MSKCHYCNKELVQGEGIWYIAESGEEYCYQDIENMEGVYSTCIGKELLRCEYTDDFILKLFKSDLEDREIDIFYTEVVD
ncbi:MAG: hypothetical protein RR942_01210 [Romboutsia sp.]